MNGVVVVDKPCGPTSHDVVAAARRALREKSIGHAGTLDPMATGVLVLACGKATRLVRFLTASEKEYEATVRFGVTTDSYDSSGQVVTESASRPTRDAVATALASLAGERLQMPPVYSAKKIDGHRAYDLARLARPVEVVPARVTLMASEILTWSGGDEATIRLTCSTGFYVRTLAHELGQLVGTGACLSALRRTRSGGFTIAAAAGMDRLMAGDAPVVPMSALLPELSAVRVDADGVTLVQHGRDLSREQYRPAAGAAPLSDARGLWTRVLGPTGDLVAVATSTGLPGVLHPAVVLI
jgi:tRNA pseudouridine55 synthase